MKKTINQLIIIVFFLSSCIRQENKQDGSISSEKVITDTTRNDLVKKQIFTHEDSIQYHAFDTYYFGKMKSETNNSTPTIDGMQFMVSYSNDYSYTFTNCDRNAIRFYFSKQKREAPLNQVLKIISQKYGTPKNLNSQRDIKTHSIISITQNYSWDTEYKKIILGTTMSEDSVLCTTIDIVNKKLEEENEIKSKKDENKMVKKESGKF